MRSGDTFVILLLLIAALVWFYVRSRLWYNKPRASLAIPHQDELYVPSDEAVLLLNQKGYEIAAGKTKLPVYITLDGQEMESRLFIDAYVVKDDELFLVKLARERRPLEMSASAIRERLLVYYLLYPEAAGVLYVDTSLGSIKKITFEIERD
ncbi:hypothetical protein D7M11_11895 [Paenibacillus ginsengarvi]|uniref:Uncharacterized protein n=2 Tax=Paenibacillus ginsengarvi TaxID=400777 RepID=A0A3B0CJ11_9BACL|nr:hypothetical protein D7M11_11895 [Paenibacillus ginsengarvi]